MKCIDPGHHYLLNSFDDNTGQQEELLFMKREGSDYPLNKGHHAGTNCQEVIKVLIDRIRYLDEKQIPCEENKIILQNLRNALLEFEIRAARRHNIKVALGDFYQSKEPELLPYCDVCGHIIRLSCACKRI